jgi:uncharacterized protein YcfJ
MNTHIEKQTHPLVIIAAIAVILFCGAGIAAMFGWLPHSKADQPVQLAPVAVKEEPAVPAKVEASKPDSTPAAAIKPAAPAPKKTVAKAHVPPKPAPIAKTEPATEPVAAAAPVPPAPVQVAQVPPPPPAPVKAICPNCGVIDNVREVEKPGEATGLGAVGGAVAGGLIGHQMGGGRGRDVMTVLGALGGGLAGHQVEKNVRKASEYQTVVRFENGGTQVFTSSTVPGWRIGDKVKVVNGAIEPNG